MAGAVGVGGKGMEKRSENGIRHIGHDDLLAAPDCGPGAFVVIGRASLVEVEQHLRVIDQYRLDQLRVVGPLP
ncbi:hypothetical protein D9M71_839180 [compost metagenome]